MYKIEELRAKDRNELLRLVSELKGKLLALRFENSTGQLHESHLLKTTRQDVAKIFTVLKEKEISLYDEATKKTDTKKINKKASPKASSAVKLSDAEINKMTIAQIKKELESLKIKFNSTAKKAELVELLKNTLKNKESK